MTNTAVVPKHFLLCRISHICDRCSRAPYVDTEIFCLDSALSLTVNTVFPTN